MLVWTSGFPSIFRNITKGGQKGLHGTGKINTVLEAPPAGAAGPAPGSTRVGEEIGGRENPEARSASCICGLRNAPVLDAVGHLKEYTPHGH